MKCKIMSVKTLQLYKGLFWLHACILLCVVIFSPWWISLCLWLFMWTKKIQSEPSAGRLLSAGSWTDPNGLSMLPTLPSTFSDASWISLIFSALTTLLLLLFPLTLSPSPLPLQPPSSPPHSSPAGGPSWGSLPSIRADWALAVELARSIPPTPPFWFPLSLMTMLAFGVQPGGFDQIREIDLGGRAARVQKTWMQADHSTNETKSTPLQSITQAVREGLELVLELDRCVYHLGSVFCCTGWTTWR